MIDDQHQHGSGIALLELSQSVLRERVSDVHQPEELLEQLIHEVTLSLSEDVGRALERLQKIQRVADELQLSTASIHSRRSLARAYSYKGNYQTAIDTCIEGRQIAVDNKHTVEGARIRMASMHALAELGRFEEAVEAGRSANAELVAAQEYELAARVDINLGIVFQRMERIIEALQCYDRARETLHDEDRSIGPLENNRGEALLLCNEFQKSEEAFSSALLAFTQSDAVLFSAIAEGNLADLALRQGHLTESLKRFEMARQRFERAGSPSHLARMMAEQAEAKSMLGLSTEAIHDYREAIALLNEQGLLLELTRAQFGLGRLLLKNGEHENAQRILREASTGAKKLQHRLMKARIDIARSDCLYAIGQVEEARKLVSQSLPEIGEHPIDAIPAYLLLASIAMKQGDFVEANSQLAIAQSRADQAGIQQLCASVAKAKGDYYFLQDDFSTAASTYSIAIEHVEQLRSTLQAQRFKMALSSEVAALYEKYVSSLVASSTLQTSEIFYACESARSRSLLEEIALGTRTNPKQSTVASSTHLETLEALQSRIEGLYSRLVEDDVISDRNDILRELQLVETKASDLESRLASAKDPRASVYRKPISLEELQAGLDEQTVIVSYFSTEDCLHVLVVTKNETKLCNNIGSLSEIQEFLQRLQFHVSRVVGRTTEAKRREKIESETDQLLKKVSETLISPFEELIQGDQKLVLVPTDAMYGIPFSALPLNGKRLVELCEVVVCPSASLFVAIDQSSTGVSQSTLIVARSDEQAPEVLDEAHAISSIYSDDVTLLAEDEATISSVLEAMQSATLLHFACHGRFDANRPRLSGIQLSDGWLSAGAIHRQGVSAEIVVLGACESGCTSLTESKEMLGLARSFLTSGAKTVLGTLWSVDDLYSKKFLCTFHKTLTSMKCTPATAIRLVQLEAIKQGVSIWDWAGFMLIGLGK